VTTVEAAEGEGRIGRLRGRWNRARACDLKEPRTVRPAILDLARDLYESMQLSRTARTDRRGAVRRRRCAHDLRRACRARRAHELRLRIPTQQIVTALRDGLRVRVDAANPLPLRARHQIVMHRPDHLTSYAQHIRMGEHIERHRDRPLERVLHGHERRIHRPLERRVNALTDVGKAYELRIAPPPCFQIECRRLAVRSHGTQDAHFPNHTHSPSSHSSYYRRIPLTRTPERLSFHPHLSCLAAVL